MKFYEYEYARQLDRVKPLQMSDIIECPAAVSLSGFDIQAFLLELETLSMQLQRKQTLGQMARLPVIHFFNIECITYLYQ